MLIFVGTGTGCGPNQSDGSSILDNEFTSVGSSLSIAKISGETYYGRLLFKSNSGQLYGAAVHFNINTDSSTTAFFSDFILDRLVLFVNMTTAVAIITSPVDLNVNPSYSFGGNGLSVSDISARRIGFNINFGNNANLSDVVSAAAVFTRDFSTFVGGDNATFFFIAQKASSLGAVTGADLLGAWFMIDFQVAGYGALILGSPSKMAVGGSGGRGYTVFRGTDLSGSVSYGGEYNLTDAGTGASGLGYDSTPQDASSITMDGTVDGAFLLSPSKRFILGFDARSNKYFAGSR